MKIIGRIIPLLLLLAACKSKPAKTELPFYNSPDFTPVWLKPGDAGYSTIHTISPFSFTNQFGASISNKNIAGKIYVANFFFTSCGSICPRMMENLAKVQDVFAKDDRVRILSHSVTPLRDSVPVLLDYAKKHQINGRQWWLLTGSQQQIYAMARRAYFADEATGFNRSLNEFLHTENIVLVDAHGRIRGVYNGTLSLEVDHLIDHIKLLETEN